ncbi:MAG: hypothetical protein AB7U81_04000 [Thiohalomonadaceae bacterium]
MSMRYIRRSILGLVVLGATGCSALPSAPAMDVDPCSEPSVSEAAHLSFTLAPATDHQAPSRAEPLLIAEGDDILARALLLTLRGAPGDENEARRLLASWQAEGHGGGETAAAQLTRMLETRLEEIQHLRAALDQERQQRERLQQQLDELMNIEQQLNQRLQAPAVEIPSP